MEVTPDRKRWGYASRCWQKLRTWDRTVADFISGMAEGAKRPIADIALLLLHEEIYHTKHCTGLGATGNGTRDGSPVVGQNWDWAQQLYPWSSLVRSRTDSMPATLTYAYPGLWASAGINEHGLSLVWTGAGYFPRIRPRVGVPTYALIAGILGCRTCRDAIALIQRTPLAGCFIFFLGDAEGEVWLVEGLPGRIAAIPCDSVIGRANHYECAGVCRGARQEVPKPTLRANTRARRVRVVELLEEYQGQIDRSVVEAILTDHGVRPGLDICQHLVLGRPAVTIDSFYALPSKKEFWIARGTPCRHRYERHVP